MFAFYVPAFAACVSVTLASTTTVLTEYGSVWSDVILTTKNGNKFLAFRGIPYAAPPVGPLRFEPPQKHEKWHEPRNATVYGSACYQDRRISLTSEDCLFVNVYTPDVEPKKLLPVLIYIHGGAFQMGTGNWFSANNFMDSPPIVMVTFNYRLGVFGECIDIGFINKPQCERVFEVEMLESNLEIFNSWYYNITSTVYLLIGGAFIWYHCCRKFVSTYHEGFLSSGDDILPGNYALKDQVAALKWVQTNIRHFGGDPKNVTLMGQSSGAHNVHAHTFSHASEGLFHRAIMLSGSTFAFWGYYPPQSHEAQHTFNVLLEQTNCKKSHPEASVECLRRLDPDDLKLAEMHFLANRSIPFLFRMVIEPAKAHHPFLTNDPLELKYRNPKIPIIVGACSAEGTMNTFSFFKAHPNEKEFSRVLDDVLPFSLHYKYWLKQYQVPSFTERLKNFFFENPHYITSSDFFNLNRLFGKMLFQMPAVDMAISYPGKVYAYFYDHFNADSSWNHNRHGFNIASMKNFTGAEHGDDLLSIFGTQDSLTRPLPEGDQKISDQVVAYLKNFIYTGNPNSKVTPLPKWNAVYTKQVEYLHIAKDECIPSSGLAEDPSYTFYRSLHIPWHKVPEDVAGGSVKISHHVRMFTLIGVVILGMLMNDQRISTFS